MQLGAEPDQLGQLEDLFASATGASRGPSIGPLTFCLLTLTRLC